MEAVFNEIESSYDEEIWSHLLKKPLTGNFICVAPLSRQFLRVYKFIEIIQKVIDWFPFT